jgi:hypothetical protein
MPVSGSLPDVMPHQAQTIAFDFGNLLPPGITLTGTPSVILTTSFGPDNAPQSRIVDGPSIGEVDKSVGGTGVANAAILVVVGNCVPGTTYIADAYCPRTDSNVVEASVHFQCVPPS